MRVEDEASLTLDVAGETLHLIVGIPHADGTVPAHLLDEHVSIAAYAVVFDLTGHLRHAEAVVVEPDRAPRVLAALPTVEPAVWRQGLAIGLRRRVSVLEQLQAENADVAVALAGSVARTRADVEALECDDPRLRAVLAKLAPTWTGSVDALREAARRARPR